MIKFINSGTKTTDATATANDIIFPKTAYVNKEKITGAIQSTYKYADASVVDALSNLNNTYVNDIDIVTNNIYVYVESYTNIKAGLVIDGAIQPSTYTISRSDIGLGGGYIYDCKFSPIQTKGVIKCYVNCYYSQKLYLKLFWYDLSTKTVIKVKTLSRAASMDGGGIRSEEGSMLTVHPTDDLAVAISWAVNNGGKIRYLGGYYDNSTDTLISKTNGELTGKNFYYDKPTSKCCYSTNSLAYFILVGPGYTYAYRFNYDTNTHNVVYSSNVGAVRYYTNCDTYFQNGSYYLSNGQLIKSVTPNINYAVPSHILGSYLLFIYNSLLYIYKVSNDDVELIQTYSNYQSSLYTSFTSINSDVIYASTEDKIYSKIEIAAQGIASFNRLGIEFRDTSSGTVERGDVLFGEIAYGASGEIKGSMPNNGALSYTPSTLQQTIPAGYTSGGTVAAVNNQTKSVTPTTSQQTITPDSGYNGLGQVNVSAVDNTIDENIVAGNIKKDVTILGVIGTLEEGSGGGDETVLEIDETVNSQVITENGKNILVLTNQGGE